MTASQAPTIPQDLDAPLTLAGRTLSSRLIVGTGKYADYPTMQKALDASGAQVITVAVRRERLINDKGESLS
jgi:thiazole synthase